MKNTRSLFTRNYDYLLVATGMAIFYFLITLPFGYFQHINTIMFYSPDSRSYGSVADWILGSGVSSYLLTRPFLYPLIIMIGKTIAGSYGIWGLQLIMWIISGLLMYRTLKITTRNYYICALGSVLYTGNVTLILLTLHALTEVTAILLISILIAWIINIKNIEKNHFWSVVLFMLSLLVLVKPLFIYVWIILLLYRIVTFMYDRLKQQNSWKHLGFLFVAILPILVQVSLMEIKFDQFTISNIGSATLKNYLFARVYGDINQISVEQARIDTVDYSQVDIYKFLLTHIGTTIESYFKSIINNIISKSNFVNIPRQNKFLYEYMKLVNIGYSVIHTLMIPVSIILLVLLSMKRLRNESMIILLLLILLCMIFISSGITFGQGDRIILPSLPVWIILYCTVFSWLYNIVKVKTIFSS